jgi:hypothetical protein
VRCKENFYQDRIEYFFHLFEDFMYLVILIIKSVENSIFLEMLDIKNVISIAIIDKWLRVEETTIIMFLILVISELLLICYLIGRFIF